ncbi:MAG: twin-arginine translocase TatA/TatE family subunit, partial [Rhodospirillaceae bacterium]|nr:twin-arginine translocase TatA/TatE family subunit [Rhodospirillaceae bacterium]
KGIKSFKAGMAEDDQLASKPQESADGDDAKTVQASAAKDETAKS